MSLKSRLLQSYLKMTQETALEVLLSEHNVFLTGYPGAGKTFLIDLYISKMRASGKKVAVTASTGIAASQLDGSTIHFWAGIGPHPILKNSKQIINSEVRDRVLTTDILIIDEVSMLEPALLEYLDDMLKSYRKSIKPFGGIKLVLVGDFYQLPPVNKSNNIKYCFESRIWEELNLKICYLTEQFRQDNEDKLQRLLINIRNQKLSKWDKELLLSRRGLSPKREITRLYSHNYDVNTTNNVLNDSLPSKARRFNSSFYNINTHSKRLIAQSSNIDSCLQLKLKSEVMFNVNNRAKGYMNGTRGKVVDFINSLPLIRTYQGGYILVDYYESEIDIANKVRLKIKYIPLKLAWALTIHKCQGMTLESAEVDLSRVFTPSMGYVALSRFRNLDSIYIKGINPLALIIDSKVLNFDRYLRKLSSRL